MVVPPASTVVRSRLEVTVALSFVFGKNCSIMDYLGLKDSSRQLRVNCAISYSFYLHLMLYACTARFDVTRNLKKNWILGGSKEGLNFCGHQNP